MIRESQRSCVFLVAVAYILILKNEFSYVCVHTNKNAGSRESVFIFNILLGLGCFLNAKIDSRGCPESKEITHCLYAY